MDDYKKFLAENVLSEDKVVSRYAKSKRSQLTLGRSHIVT